MEAQDLVWFELNDGITRSQTLALAITEATIVAARHMTQCGRDPIARRRNTNVQ
jgi:hypothetical protein